MSLFGPIVEDLRKPKCKKRYHADSRPQPQKRRDNIGVLQSRPRQPARCSPQHFDSTGQFTIPAQFAAAQSRQNWRVEQIKVASSDSAQIQSPSVVMRHNPFMAHEFF
jgi:hypothetical protein